MKSAFLTCVWALTATLAVTDYARAQEAAEYSATAVAQRPIASTNAEDATASGTVITTQDRHLALESVSEAMREAPGTRAQQLGGFGSFSGLSLRGADTAHTTVLLGNLPLDSVDEGAFDFSLLPLAMLDGVVVYRGGAPAWLGEGGIGGVVQLLPSSARESGWRTSAGLGSFGRTHLSLGTNLAPNASRGVSLQTHVALDAATNDFPYRDPGAPLVTGDERDRRTQNAQVTQGNAMVHASAPLAGGEIDVLWMAVGRSAGIPGPQRAPSLFAHRQLGRSTAAVGYTFKGKLSEGRRYRVQALIGAGYQFNRVSDRGQINTTFFAETDDRWSNGFGRLAGSLEITRALELTLITLARLDHWAPQNSLARRTPPRPSQRISEIAVAEARLHGDVFGLASELRGSARVQFSQASIQATRTEESERRDVNAITPTLRLAAVTAPTTWLSLGASLATGQRLPTFGELFGDRAFLQPNPDLLPETSLSTDVSATLMTHLDALCLQLEVRAFHLGVDDFVTYLRSARFDARPENIGYVTIRGVEVGSKLSYDTHAALTFSATAMDSNTPLGHQAPNTPNLVLYARPEASVVLNSVVNRITAFTDLSVVSFNYTDKSNLHAIPGRQWLGIGAAVHMLDDRIEIQVRASNLLDQQSEDLNGFALPRRALMASLTVQESL